MSHMSRTTRGRIQPNNPTFAKRMHSNTSELSSDDDHLAKVPMCYDDDMENYKSHNILGSHGVRTPVLRERSRADDDFGGDDFDLLLQEKEELLIALEEQKDAILNRDNRILQLEIANRTQSRLCQKLQRSTPSLDEPWDDLPEDDGEPDYQRKYEQAMAVAQKYRQRALELEHVTSLDTFEGELEELRYKCVSLENRLDEALGRYHHEARERKALFNQMQELKGNVRIYCRGRPLTDAEARDGTEVVTFDDLGEVTVFSESSQSAFSFDACFGPTASQAQVFEEVRPLVQKVLMGGSVCLLATGHKGTGKSYTMQGTASDPGLSTRALEELFTQMEHEACHLNYEIDLSLFQVHEETILDLISPSPAPLSVIRDPVSGKRSIENLSRSGVTCLEDVEGLLAGAKKKEMDRAHVVLRLDVVALDPSTGNIRAGSLHLVEMATAQDKQGRQGINAMGSVLTALSQKQKKISYSASSLTLSMTDALSPKSTIALFVTVSPAARLTPPTIASLTFATNTRAEPEPQAADTPPSLTQTLSQVSTTSMDSLPQPDSNIARLQALGPCSNRRKERGKASRASSGAACRPPVPKAQTRPTVAPLPLGNLAPSSGPSSARGDRPKMSKSVSSGRLRQTQSSRSLAVSDAPLLAPVAERGGKKRASRASVGIAPPVPFKQAPSPQSDSLDGLSASPSPPSALLTTEGATVPRARRATAGRGSRRSVGVAPPKPQAPRDSNTSSSSQKSISPPPESLTAEAAANIAARRSGKAGDVATLVPMRAKSSRKSVGTAPPIPSKRPGRS